MKEEKQFGKFNEELNRREFLKSMACAASGLLFTVNGGIPHRFNLLSSEGNDAARESSFSFVQISDSHIGFNAEPNRQVLQTFSGAVAKITKSETKPDLVLHTGDITHNGREEEFESADQVLKQLHSERYFVPGERDVLPDNGKSYRNRFGKNSKGDGWYSFDHKGVHFVGLVNVMDYKVGECPSLGGIQLEWVEKDLAPLKDSNPIVVFSHVPLWLACSEWGWGTRDGERALNFLRRFGSVTVLNGHVHQSMQKIEGNITFHSARSTAYPLPAPKTATSPDPITIAASSLKSLLGISNIQYFQDDPRLTVIDTSLAYSDGLL